MKRVAVVALGAMIVFGAAVAAAQSSDDLAVLRKEIEALKAGQANLLKELQEIRTLLRARPAAQAAPEPRDIALALDGGPVKGDSRASLVLVDFTDYQ
jgi:hypothetical protein